MSKCAQGRRPLLWLALGLLILGLSLFPVVSLPSCMGLSTPICSKTEMLLMKMRRYHKGESKEMQALVHFVAARDKEKKQDGENTLKP